MTGCKWCLVLFSSFFSLVFSAAKPVEDSFTTKIIANKRTSRSADIIFPEDDDFFSSTEVLPRLEVPPTCADGSTFCENFMEYPHNYLKNVLKEHHVNNEVFGKDAVPEFGTRDGNADTFICKSSVRTIFPRVGKNIRNDWRIIINQGEEEGYVQGVVIETCLGKGRPCDLIGDLVNDYVTTCKQKFIYRRLLSLSDNGKPIQDTFMLPSACCCTYRRNFDFMSRLGKKK